MAGIASVSTTRVVCVEDLVAMFDLALFSSFPFFERRKGGGQEE